MKPQTGRRRGLAPLRVKQVPEAKNKGVKT